MKKIFCYLLIAALVLGTFAGCKKQDTSPTESTRANQTENTKAKQTQSTETHNTTQTESTETTEPENTEETETENTEATQPENENANPYPTLEITDYRIKIENNQKVFDSYPYFSVAFPTEWKCYIRQGEDGSNYYFQDPALGDKCRLTVSLAEAWTAKDRTEEEYRKLHPSRHLESLTTETIDGLQGKKIVYTYTKDGTEYVMISYVNFVDRLRAFSLDIVYPADQKDVYEPIFNKMIASAKLYRYPR